MLQLTETVTDLLEEAGAENCAPGSVQEQSGKWPFYCDGRTASSSVVSKDIDIV